MAAGKEDPPPKRTGPPPASLTEPLPREKLSADLQKLADKDDDFFDELYSGNMGDTTNSSVRYAAYANRLRTIMLSAQRYVAYTSDVGESFRPVAHPNWVRGAYAVSWAYLIGDVGNEGYKAYCRNRRVLKGEGEGTAATPGFVPAIEDYRAIMAQRAVFQSVASMGLPAFTIHSIVRYSGRAMKDVKNVRLRTWGPIGLGLAAVPALPYMFDKPVEEAVEWVFYTAFKAVGGEKAVGTRNSTGRKMALEVDAKKMQKVPEKEL